MRARLWPAVLAAAAAAAAASAAGARPELSTEFFLVPEAPRPATRAPPSPAAPTPPPPPPPPTCLSAANCTAAGAAATEHDGVLRRETWVVPLLVVCSVSALLMLGFEVFVVCKARQTAPSRRHLFLGQTLLLGLLLCAAVAAVAAATPTPAVCATIRMGAGVSYAVVFSALLVKCVFLISLNGGVYLPAAYQALLLAFAVLTQVAVGVQWLLASPPAAELRPLPPLLHVRRRGAVGVVVPVAVRAPGGVAVVLRRAAAAGGPAGRQVARHPRQLPRGHVHRAERGRRRAHRGRLAARRPAARHAAPARRLRRLRPRRHRRRRLPRHVHAQGPPAGRHGPRRPVRRGPRRPPQLAQQGRLALLLPLHACAPPTAAAAAAAQGARAARTHRSGGRGGAGAELRADAALLPVLLLPALHLPLHARPRAGAGASPQFRRPVPRRRRPALEERAVPEAGRQQPVHDGRADALQQPQRVLPAERAPSWPHLLTQVQIMARRSCQSSERTRGLKLLISYCIPPLKLGQSFTKNLCHPELGFAGFPWC